MHDRVYSLLGTNVLYTLPVNLAMTNTGLLRAFLFLFLTVGDHMSSKSPRFGSGSLAEATQFKTYSCAQNLFYLFFLHLG